MTKTSSHPPRILFLVTTATEDPCAVDQLTELLSPHRVLIRHDHRARAVPGFRLARHVEMSPGRGEAGWGVWPFVAAIRDAMRDALLRYRFDYVQLLTGSCLPIRPIGDFVQFVATSPAQIHLDALDLRDHPGAVSNYAARCLSDSGSLSNRLLLKLRRMHLGRDPALRTVSGMEVPTPRGLRALGTLEPVFEAMMHWQGRRAPGAPGVPTTIVGSGWCGMRRIACELLVERLSDPRVEAYFARRHPVDEHAIPAILHSSGLPMARSNHLVNRFDRLGHPVRFKEADFDRIMSSGRWFARKFPNDPDAPIRRTVMEWVRQDQTEAIAA